MEISLFESSHHYGFKIIRDSLKINVVAWKISETLINNLSVAYRNIFQEYRPI